MRRTDLIRLLLILFLAAKLVLPQSTNGTISGMVFDPAGKAIPGAEILLVNDATGISYPGATNGEGIYAIPNLPPGPYRIQVSKSGFKTLIKPDIVLHVEDALAVNFTLPIGAASEILTVEGGVTLLNTSDAAVSTVVDHKYVENMPLNGRSLQDLILLTPGVVTNNPQSGANGGVSGEFSVNGQRTESNSYAVDGVSANLGIFPSNAATPAVSGSLPASTALGTTHGLVSVDALEEFRVQSSSYSAEFGRNPGGQFSFVTRSGTNEWHGTAFDYLRNNVFDANDWFNDLEALSTPPERQNDFGGTLGGPIWFPAVRKGRERTFFFVSYEGLRLLQPQAASISYVPTIALRGAASSALQPVLNGFPQPHCPASAPDCREDLGNGLGEYIGTWSNPSSIDAFSIRLDQAVSDRLKLFFRFSDTPSSLNVRVGGNFASPSNAQPTGFTTRTYTFGATGAFSPGASNEFRLNFATNGGNVSGTPDSFGDATAVNLFALQGFNGKTQPKPNVLVSLSFGPVGTLIKQFGNSGEQKQWNLVDSLTASLGQHQLKFGFDLRRLEPAVYVNSPVVDYIYRSAASVQNNSPDFGFAFSFAPAHPVYTNFSAFAQDQWKLTPRFNLSIGLRWEVNPAPGASKGNLPYTVEGTDLNTLTLAPEGTPLWRTTWFNIAPRLGAAYTVRPAPGFETVLRGAVGVFFDTGQQLGSYGYQGPGFSAGPVRFGTLFGRPANFPIPPAQASPPIVNPPVAPYTNSNVYAFPAHLQLPFTLQWNVSVQQALGESQAVTLSYVGANARRLLEQNEVDASSFNPDFGTIFFIRNGHTSDHAALEVQYQRRLLRGLEALASYTWAHTIDYGSQNASLPYLRGNSDYDIRNNVSGALSFDLQHHFHDRWVRAILEHWGLDDRFTARTGFPVTLAGNSQVDPATGSLFNAGLDLVPGKTIYVEGSSCANLYGNGFGCPGGRAINPQAFCDPTAGPCSGTGAGRNFARGLGAWQMDLALRREFPVHERLRVQFRAEAFNLFNHANFGTINPNYCSLDPSSPSYSSPCTFGQATQTLANSLGGLSSLYQMGGPRSLQFALKLLF